MCSRLTNGYIEPKKEEKKVVSLLKPYTNFDRIKNMNIDELAATIMCPNEIVCLDKKQIRCGEIRKKHIGCIACCKKWLESEAEK